MGEAENHGDSARTGAGEFDSGKFDGTHAPESHIKQEYATKGYRPRWRPAEQSVADDPMAKFRKWGYEEWPPEHEGMPFVLQPDVDSPMYRGRQWFFKLMGRPAFWAHDSLEKWRFSRPGWKRPVYYHRRYTRVTPIDQCEEGDIVCVHEANNQFTRDRKVEGFIINLLRERIEHCFTYEHNDWASKCKKLIDDWMDANTNFKIKYGEMGLFHNVITAYMKQKHRMIWERRYPERMYGLYGVKYTENRFYPPSQIQYDAEYPIPK